MVHSIVATVTDAVNNFATNIAKFTKRSPVAEDVFIVKVADEAKLEVHDVAVTV